MPKQPRDYLNIEFRAGDLEPAIMARAEGSTHQTARRDLGRYYTLLAASLRRVVLSEAEASLIVDALNGTAFLPEMVPPLAIEIGDAIQIDHLDTKWEIDGAALLAKIRTWSPSESMAVVDAVERFWHDGAIEDMSERLRTVGLVRNQTARD